MAIETAKGVRIVAKVPPQYADILSLGAQEFLALLHRTFDARRKELLQKRVERQKAIDAGQLPDFLPETQWIRDDPTWKGAPPAPGLHDRRVEITGPVDRKMVINALNAGAKTFMADFEDSNAPTWDNNLSGQVNLRDAIRRKIDFVAPNGKFYQLNPDESQLAVLLVRPRGWHLEEAHFLVDGAPMSGALFDFGLYFYHNAAELLRRGAGPYFYLPKMESHLEARLWNDTFNLAQDTLRIPRGSIRGTVLIETILAAFEMEEIIYELRDHSSGLNCGRWDYIFSYIKKLRAHPEYVLPDRAAVGMTSPFMSAYVRLLIKTCHKRGVHAMGGMAAQIPIKDDPKANEAAMEKVRADKRREARAGHDGTWVAHPALIPIAKAIFDAEMPQPNQLHRRTDDVVVTARDLLSNAGIDGGVTERGVRENVDVALQYMEAWLRGSGCVPIHNLMEDAATAEISRSQLYQWVHHQVTMTNGQKVTPELVRRVLDEDLAQRRKTLGEAKWKQSRFELAAKYLAGTVGLEGTRTAYADFLTTLCYEAITTRADADQSTKL
ncbi:hypothetical protein CXG81DRAFT_26330 [Caulochytrium protostelioides]|uniref:Malate synthase n=1 Tax=Caulochytrium protostelioides TaxID=1555241 RepID=A0A4P9X6Z2_9FUNG|nr:hypothetical protein CXG81DRAFT_26330 [Caulochytrium protostelioides]|eukprot:RKP00973.1 hypothetical protein CXG81DRAFT_26330 [Caulochytrium protostelioides]